MPNNGFFLPRVRYYDCDSISVTSFGGSCLHFNVSPTNESGKDDIEVVSSDDNDDDVNVANAEVEAEVDEITI